MPKQPPPERTRFKKGQSGNPAGRPKRLKLKARLRQYDAIAEKALIDGLKKREPMAMKLFYSYREGLPSQSVKISGHVSLESLTDEQLEAKWKAIQEKLSNPTPDRGLEVPDHGPLPPALPEPSESVS